MGGIMKNVNVYNNGRGWRISFPIGRVIQVLTVDEAKELKDALESSIEYASHQADTPDREHPATNKGKSVAQLEKEYKAHRRAHPGR